jgi:hypothetical protein
MSPTSQNTTTHSIDEPRNAVNEGVSIISAPKNVKFIIPFGRSGLTSNDSTFGVLDSTTRTITHVKDIFPLNPPLQSQTTPTANNGDNIVTGSSSANSITTSSSCEAGRHRDEHEMMKSDSEQQSLLQNDDSTKK